VVDRSGGRGVALHYKEFAGDWVKMQLTIVFVNAFMGFVLESKVGGAGRRVLRFER
jgi:hypothetical protein